MSSQTCLKKVLASIDCQKVLDRLNEDIKRKKEFIESNLFKKMCSDIIQANETISNENFMYETEIPTKTKLHWLDLKDDQIEQFFSAMCYINDVDFDIDEDCPFDNYIYTRNGLQVTLMYGQGTLITLTPLKQQK